MIKAIFYYEFKAWLRTPIFYGFIFILFFAAFLMMLGTAGFFDDPELNKGWIRIINSHYELNFIFNYFNKFLVFVAATIMGNSIYKDYKNNAHQVLYSFPIKKKNYLLGKVLSGLTVSIIISLFLGIAILIATAIIGIDNQQITSFNATSYIHTYLLLVIPNIIIFGLSIFMLVAMSRNIYAAFIFIIAAFLFKVLTENLFINLPHWIALLDPFGQNASLFDTKNWSLNDHNVLPLPWNSWLLYNRLFWLGLTGLLSIYFYKNFKLYQESTFFQKVLRKNNKSNAEYSQTQDKILQKEIAISFDFSTLANLRSIWNLAKIEFIFMIKSWMFYTVLIAGTLAIFFMLLMLTKTGEFTLLPLTRLLLSIPFFFYQLILMLATFLYAGILVYRSRQRKMHWLIDTCPVPNWVLFSSKFLALIKLQIVLLLCMFICGVSIQMYNEYYIFEFGQYAYYLFILSLPSLIIWAAISLFTHNLSPNIFLGLFALIGVWMVAGQLEQIGLNSNIFKINMYPELKYSDFHQYGIDLKVHQLLKSYWSVFAIILAILCIGLWTRGIKISIFEKVRRFKLNSKMLFALVFSMLIFSFLAFTILKNEENILTDKAFNKMQNSALKRFKANFEPYKHLTPPKIKSINLNLDLYPTTQSFQAFGHYIIENTSKNNIDTILIKTGFDEISTLNLNLKYQLLSIDSTMQYRAIKLSKPLAPGDIFKLEFAIKNKPNLPFSTNSNVLSNGTFIKHDILPRMGYLYNDIELPRDSVLSAINFYHQDVDHCSIETRISTSESQIAIAPGDLLKKEVVNKRAHFHYKSNDKQKFNFSFHSGVYEKYSEKYNKIDLDIYYHESHYHNLERMTSGLKQALDYLESNIASYPGKQIRIIEFPHTQDAYSATLMGNNIPTSEILFNINSEAMEDKIDLPFYVMAHELCHEMFGNKVMPSANLGAKLLTESLAEYLSLRIYKSQYGNVKANKFLETQHNRYLKGSKKETQVEEALFNVRADQDYIAYGKGAVAFNTIAHYIGESELNNILKIYIQKYEHNEIGYPSSLNFLELLEKSCPSEYQYLINDFLRKKVFYDNSITKVEWINNGKSNNSAKVTLSINKFNSDKSKPIPIGEEYFEIGCYSNEHELMQVVPFKLQKGESSIILEIDKEFSYLILDPNLLLIDIDRKNNQIKVN